MNAPDVEVTLRPSGTGVPGTLIGPEFSHGPSRILLHGMKPARLVAREDWVYLPGEEPEARRA